MTFVKNRIFKLYILVNESIFLSKMTFVKNHKLKLFI